VAVTGPSAMRASYHTPDIADVSRVASRFGGLSRCLAHGSLAKKKPLLVDVPSQVARLGQPSLPPVEPGKASAMHP